MASSLRARLWLMGVAITAIGVYHLVGGVFSVPGTDSVTGEARATVDSRERFYNVIFAGYGLAWIWAVRHSPVPASVVRWLAGTFLVAGLARLLSWAVEGAPHWFQIPLIGLELVLPPILFWLADADERAHAGDGIVPDIPAADTPYEGAERQGLSGDRN